MSQISILIWQRKTNVHGMGKYLGLPREESGYQEQDWKGRGRDQPPGRKTFVQKDHPGFCNTGVESLSSHWPNKIPSGNFHRCQTPKRAGWGSWRWNLQGPKGTLGIVEI